MSDKQNQQILQIGRYNYDLTKLDNEESRVAMWGYDLDSFSEYFPCTILKISVPSTFVTKPDGSLFEENKFMSVYMIRFGDLVVMREFLFKHNIKYIE
jgi:hypothetical protein